ncbi:MAG: anti-sigma factor family protein [Blastocatellia bacterium]
MNCTNYRRLLSDFHDGLLKDVETSQVRTHLMICLPCREIFHDLELIVTAAAELYDETCVTCPDETASWKQFELAALNSAGVAGSQQWLRR